MGHPMFDNHRRLLDEAEERLKNDDYPLGGLGMMRRHYDEKVTGENKSVVIKKDGLIKKIVSFIKRLFK